MPSSLYRVAAVTAVVLVACSGTFLGSSEEPSPAEPMDATVAPADVAPVSTDSAPPAPPRDAGTDAPADTGPATPCTRPNLFCDDFDDPDGSVGAKWASVVTAAGPFLLDETLPVSRPRALQLKLSAGSGVRSSCLTRELNVPGDVKISLDARLDMPPTGTFGKISPLTIGIGPNGAGVDYQVFDIGLYSDSMQFEVFRAYSDGGTLSSGVPINVPYGTYRNLAVTLRSVGGTTNAVLEIDGVVTATRSLQTQAPRSITLQVGAPYTDNANITATVRVDNVIVERL